VGLDQRKVAERDTGRGERPLPCLGAAFELQDVAPAHRQEILHMRSRAERNGLAQTQRGLDVGQHHRRRSVRHQGTIGALERPGDERVLLAGGAAEIVAQILAQLRVGVADAVLVIFRRYHRQRVGLVAPALEVEIRNPAENAGKAAFDVGLLAHVGRFQQVFSDLGSGRRRHLLDADHQNDARGLRGDRAQPLLDRGGTRGAGILDPRGALESEFRGGLQHQRGGEILRRKAGVEVAQHDLIDVRGRDSGVREGPIGHLDNETFDGGPVQPAEWRVSPTDDAAGHCGLLLVAFFWDLPRPRADKPLKHVGARWLCVPVGLRFR
jgi:hypothetical protein